MERQRFVYLRIASSFLILGLGCFTIFAVNYKYKETIFLNGRVTSDDQSLLLKSPITAKINSINVSSNSGVAKDQILLTYQCDEIAKEYDKIAFDLKSVEKYIILNEEEIKNQSQLSNINVGALTEYSDIYEDLSRAGAVSELQAKDFKSKVESAKIEAEQRISALKRRDLELQQSRNSLAKDLFKASKEKSYCKFKSPSSGIISEVYVRPKELVGKGAEMLRIFSNSSPQISFGLPSQFVENVQIGDTFDVRVVSYPYQKYGVMKAVVESISPVTSDMIRDNNNPLNAEQSASKRSGDFFVEAIITTPLQPIEGESSPVLKNGIPVIALFKSTEKKLIYILSDQFLKLQNSIEAMRSRF